MINYFLIKNHITFENSLKKQSISRENKLHFRKYTKTQKKLIQSVNIILKIYLFRRNIEYYL